VHKLREEIPEEAIAMILMTGLSHDPDVDCQGELLECIRRNVDADRIDEIHLFVEDPGAPDKLKAQSPLNSAKVRLIRNEQHVTFQDLFASTNQHLIGRIGRSRSADSAGGEPSTGSAATNRGYCPDS
jgi:hypothetical protein